MKSMLAGFAAVILIAIAADLLLDEYGPSLTDPRSGDAVRLGDATE